MSRLRALLRERCPEGVEYVDFGNFCEFIKGITYNKNQEARQNDPGCIKVLRANNINHLTNNTFANYEVGEG